MSIEQPPSKIARFPENERITGGYPRSWLTSQCSNKTLRVCQRRVKPRCFMRPNGREMGFAPPSITEPTGHAGFRVDVQCRPNVTWFYSNQRNLIRVLVPSDRITRYIVYGSLEIRQENCYGSGRDFTGNII